MNTKLVQTPRPAIGALCDARPYGHSWVSEAGQASVVRLDQPCTTTNSKSPKSKYMLHTHFTELRGRVCRHPDERETERARARA